MRTYYLNKLSEEEVNGLTKRPAINLEKIFEIVRPVLNEIKAAGLQAALKYAKNFDGFEGNEIKVTKEEFDESEKELSLEIKYALETAYNNIKKFHLNHLPSKY